MKSIRKAYALLLKRAALYRKGGWKSARPLRRSLEDYESHLFAFLIDLNICLLPVYLWMLEFLLILTGLIPPRFFDLLFYLMYGLLFVVAVLGLGIVTSRLHGQSLGYAFLNLKLVRRNRKEAGPLQLILRQMLGVGIPLMVCGIIFALWGWAAWFAADALIILLTPHQQNLFDLLLGLITVRVPDDSQLLEAEPKPAPAAPAKHLSSVDLHIRSNYSDDARTDVEDIFKAAKEGGVQAISITDHNCARANGPAMRFARLYGIQYIPGAEFDGQYNGRRLRILGYYIDWKNPVFDTLERNSLKREKDLSMERVRRFEQYAGIQVDVRSLMESSRFQTITGSDLTRMLFNNQTTRQMPLVQKYLTRFANPKAAMKQFEHDVFGKGGPCYVKAAYPSAASIIKAIHDAGGVAILAAWHLDSMSDGMLAGLIDLGIDGIECFTPALKEDTMVRLLQFVLDRKLLVTAGSDYHGPGHGTIGETAMPAKGEALVRRFTKMPR